MASEDESKDYVMVQSTVKLIVQSIIDFIYIQCTVSSSDLNSFFFM